MLLGPLQILLCSPLVTLRTDALPLEREVEQFELRTALKTWIVHGEVRLVISNDGRFATLTQLLHSQAWHVVIFSGHGVKNGYELCLLFATASGQAELISTKELIQLFKSVTVQCVVLAACHSGESINGNSSLAEQLAQIIPHVIGMQGILLDRAGQHFIKAFATSLAQRQTIAIAMQQGCQAMTKLLNDSEVWHLSSPDDLEKLVSQQGSLPILYSRNPAMLWVDGDFRQKPEIPIFSEYSIQLPSIFMGRHVEIQQVIKKLKHGKTQQLLIRGAGGLGKTAFAGKLVEILVEQENYQVITYQIGENTSFLDKIKPLLAKRLQNRWVLWLEGLEKIQNSQENTVITNNPIISYLNQVQVTNLKILMTSRYPIPQLFYYDDYLITKPQYSDFQRYVHYLGLPYSCAQIKLIYQAVHGNFKGVQLLQNLSSVVESENFLEKLAIVQRYLKAIS